MEPPEHNESVSADDLRNSPDLLCCIMQSLCFGYWSISEDDSYVDISVRCWGYFTGLVGRGFGVLVGRMVITLEGLESSGAGALIREFASIYAPTRRFPYCAVAWLTQRDLE